jgi:predicted transcriptional regulator
LNLDDLAPRQREMARVIYARGGATVREIHALIPDPPESICGLRTLLNRMVLRGVLRKRSSGRHSEICYVLADPTPEVYFKAFNRIAIDHFGGSRTRAFGVLVRLAASGRF